MTAIDGASGREDSGGAPAHISRPVMAVRRDWEGRTVTATPRRDIALALPLNEEFVGEVRLYRITLPFLPPSKNVYNGWLPQWKSSHKKKWIKHVVAECEALNMPKGVATIGVSAVLVFPTRNRTSSGRSNRDPQNYESQLWHFVLDALVEYGLIKDDAEGRVQIGPNWGIRFSYDLRSVDKKFRERTHLAITTRV